MTRLRLAAVLGALGGAFLSLSLTAAAAPDNNAVVGAAHLELDFRAIQAAYSGTSWNAACDALGRSLTVGHGPWGMGIFGSYSCIVGAQSAARIAPLGINSWRLVVALSDGKVKISIEDGLKGGPESQVTLSAAKQLPEILQNVEIAHLVAFALLDYLPMSMAVDGKNLEVRKDGTSTVSQPYFPDNPEPANPRFRAPDPAERLFLYNLSWSPEGHLWKPVILGEAKRQALKNNEVTYWLDKRATAAARNGAIWAESAKGRGSRAVELSAAAIEAETDSLQSTTTSSVDKVTETLRESAATGYVGTRYGAEFAKGDPLIRKTRFFGLLVEIRGGPLAGLRYYYDWLPKVTETDIGSNGAPVVTSLAWSRHEFAYSFAFLPGFLLDRITVTPKLGIWNFDAVIPIERDEAGRPIATQNFRIDGAVGLGLELGAEWLSDWYTVRPWVGYDTGNPLPTNDASVSAARAGLDAYFTAGPHFKAAGVNFKTAFLAFLVGENVTLYSPKMSGVTRPQGTNYTADYTGLGVALSW